MNRPAPTIAAALLAGALLSNAAEAGGIRLGFGMPLGSFVASPFSPGSQQSYKRGSGYERMCAQREAKARAAKFSAAKREAAAKRQYAAAAADKQKAAAQRAEIAQARAHKSKTVAGAPDPKRDVEIATAKIETPAVVTDAAPAIFVPNAPPAAAAATTAPASMTMAAAAAEVATVSEIDDAVRIAAPKTEPVAEKVVNIAPVVVATTATKPAAGVSSKVQRICRRFSGLVGGLVDVPCQ